MKIRVDVGAVVVMLALVFGSMHCLAAESGKKPDDTRERIITIKTEIAETVINTPVVSVLEGAQARMTVQTATPRDPGSQSTSLDETAITWVPTVAQDGSVNLAGSIRFSRRGYRSQGVKLSATLRPGVPQKLPVVVVPAENGGGKLELALTVTATIQNSKEDAAQRAPSDVVNVAGKTPPSVAVLGEVVRPGWYKARENLTLTEVIATAGGPTAIADMTVVAILWTKGTGKPPQRSEFDLAAVMRGQVADSIVKGGDIIVVGRHRLPNRMDPMIIACTSLGEPANPTR